ncbi:MAG: hypothetical protein J5850_06665 [Clostridia bacterium]|nr:hypothetical protein [Clostridia bacterium]
MKKEFYLGIDIGTSSVKGVLRTVDGETFSFKHSYSGQCPDNWIQAIKMLVSDCNEICGGNITAVGFSSQVGTYVVKGRDVIPWYSGTGREELDFLLSVIPQEDFIKCISMYHPNLVSYPLPRLMFIQKNYGEGCDVCMPKDYIINDLTGENVTDVFSMRGIANLDNCKYADSLISRLGIKQNLPHIGYPTDLVGYVTEKASLKYGLNPDTRVYLGCNDFFAGLLGMGIYNPGDTFELSGTSEHFGYIGNEINRDAFVSGKFFNCNCSYGGTKSSGSACDFAIKNFGIEGIDFEKTVLNDAPIFLPYLNGERAPVFDDNARGVFFGIGSGTDRNALAYSVLEGVVFSIFDIAQSMKIPAPERIICSGGSSNDPLMNKIRASLFDCDIIGVCDNNTSALGACMLAMTGDGLYADLSSAVSDCVRYGIVTKPLPEYREILLKRYLVYKELYGNLKPAFLKLKCIKELKI